MARLIVVQTGGNSIFKCRKAVLELGFSVDEVTLIGEPFYGVSWFDTIMNEVNPNEGQILITGSFHGNEERAHEVVLQAKSKNPQLKAWWCSTMGSETPSNLYDHIVKVDIYKMDHYEKMMERAIAELGMVPTTNQ